jgi:hypothetical protein
MKFNLNYLGGAQFLEKFKRLYLWIIQKLGNFKITLFYFCLDSFDLGSIQHMNSVQLIQFFHGAPFFRIKSIALLAQVFINYYYNNYWKILKKTIAFPIDRGVISVLSRVFGWKESDLSKEVNKK